ncbi:hypothetical protein SODG_006833 [Sodalis praecaptivus]
MRRCGATRCGRSRKSLHALRRHATERRRRRRAGLPSAADDGGRKHLFRSTDVEPGSKTWRLSHQQLADKFVRCASASLTAAQAADVFASALDMAALPTLRSLLAALYPDARN